MATSCSRKCTSSKLLMLHMYAKLITDATAASHFSLSSLLLPSGSLSVLRSKQAAYSFGCSRRTRGYLMLRSRTPADDFKFELRVSLSSSVVWPFDGRRSIMRVNEAGKCSFLEMSSCDAHGAIRRL